MHLMMSGHGKRTNLLQSGIRPLARNLQQRLLARTSESPLRLLRSAYEFNSAGVWRECRPLPPQTYTPNSDSRGFRPLLSAPKTEVVMPEECQSIPITQPSA